MHKNVAEIMLDTKPWPAIKIGQMSFDRMTGRTPFLSTSPDMTIVFCVLSRSMEGSK